MKQRNEPSMDIEIILKNRKTTNCLLGAVVQVEK